MRANGLNLPFRLGPIAIEGGVPREREESGSRGGRSHSGPLSTGATGKLRKRALESSSALRENSVFFIFD